MTTQQAVQAPSAAPEGIPFSVLLLMAIATGLCAGGNYYNQPLLSSMATAFGISEVSAALTVTLAQVSYAVGLLLLVPFGDKYERRSLIVGMMLLMSVGQMICGFATNLTVFSVGIVIAGLFSSAAQIMVPLAAMLSHPSRASRAIGMTVSGIMMGILAARSLAGILSDLGGWNTIYRLASVLGCIMALVLYKYLPQSRNSVQPGYAQIMRSMLTLVMTQPRLRTCALMGGLSFASMGMLFAMTTLVLSGAPYHLSDTDIGLVGLVGVAGAWMANIAGKLGDRGWAQHTMAISIVIKLLSWYLLWLGGASLVWFLVGTFLLDMAQQGVNIGSQGNIYKLVPEARSRLNAIYMTTYFCGGATGSALASLAWAHAGWDGVCVLGATMIVLCGIVLLYDYRLIHKSSMTQAVKST